MDDDAAGGGRARQLLACAPCSRATARKPTSPEDAASRATSRVPISTTTVPYQKAGQRLVPGRGLSPAGLPRRRHADGRSRAGRRAAQGRRHGALPVRRARWATRPVKWTFTRSPVVVGAGGGLREVPRRAWEFVGWTRAPVRAAPARSAGDEATLTKAGELPLIARRRRPTPACPTCYTLEGDVEDVSRQHIANRASLLVHPAPWYIGVRRPRVLPRAEDRAEHRDRRRHARRQAVAGVPSTVTLTQIQWTQRPPRRRQRLLHLGHRAQGSPAGSWTVTTRHEPVPLDVPLPSGGYFVLEATAQRQRAAGSR